MKHVFFGVVLCVFFSASFFCQSSPEPAGDANASAPSTVDSSVHSGDASSISAETAGPATAPDAATADSSTAAVPADAAAQPDAASSGAVADAPIQQAESPETVPQVPAAERLLYFYPEPDFLYVPPIAPVTAPQKTVTKPAVVPTEKNSTTTATAPAKNVEKQSSTTTPAKASDKAGDKAAEKSTTKKAADAKSSDAKASDAKSANGEKSTEAMPGIWTSESVAPATQASMKSVAVAPVPSRKVSLALGQTLEVWYPGSGWVYLGDVSAQNGLNYESRKLDKSDTIFAFRSLRAGDYILEFSRYDVLSDSYSSDLIAVTVTDDGSRKAGKVRAPDYRSALPDAATAQAGQLLAQSSTLREEPSLVTPSAQSSVASQVPVVPQTAAAVQAAVARTASGQSAPASDAVALLAKAKASLASGDAVAALSTLDSFFGAAVDSLDEGWFLRGQAYEANSASRDIRKALGAYQTLVSAFPESSRWNEADARIRYIKQYYLGR